MTTVATDGITMASDGQVTGTSGFIHTDSQQKMFRLKDGSLVGMAGSLFEFQGFIAWFERADEDEVLELDEDFSALVLTPDGAVSIYDNLGNQYPATVPAVIGTGGPYALCAMDAGATVEEAVRIATKRDSYSGGDVTVMKLVP